MSQLYSYAGGDTAKGIGIQLHGILKGKEQLNDLREVPGVEVKVPEPRVLVPWILRRHSGQECKKETGVHPAPVGRG